MDKQNKTYNIIGENYTTVPKNGSQCDWKNDRTGCTFFYNVKFETEDISGYTIELLENLGDKNNNSHIWYKYRCIETNYLDEIDTSILVKIMNNTDKYIKPLISLCYGKKHYLGNGLKATNRDYNKIMRIGVHKKTIEEFINNYEKTQYIYGIHNKQLSYIGITNNIFIRLKQHNCNSESSAYVILQELDSNCSPLILVALETDDNRRYIYEEIITQANRLTLLDMTQNTNKDYTRNMNRRKTKARLQELVKNLCYWIPMELLNWNLKRLNINILIYDRLTEEQKTDYNELVELLKLLGSSTPKQYARLIYSLYLQFDLDYIEIWNNLIDDFEFKYDL